METPKEVKRIHIALRMGSQGMSIKLTSASSDRLRSACQKAAEKYHCESWYQFDGPEAIILVPDKTVPLLEYKP